MRYFYSFLFYLAVPFIFIRLFYKSKRLPSYYQRWHERFALYPAPALKDSIWIHAVSVGETIAAVPLIKKIQQETARPIVLTTMTPTGSERVRAIFDDSVFHVYIPYDLPCTVQRFLKKIKPSVAIIMETELWPNYLHYCYKAKIPVLLANGRLSQKSMQGYLWLKHLTKKMLQQFSTIAVQSQQDKERFLMLGADSKQIEVIGSMKFDIHIPASIQEQAQGFRNLLGKDRLIWIAASTHEGEEEKILSAFKKVQQNVSNVLLVIVPRHPERFDKVAELCKKQGFELVRRSENKSCHASTEIFLGDSMGELLTWYAASDLAFVGGSLEPVGGHNLLEPAALAKAAITGPHVLNFQEITQKLIDNEAVVMVQDEEALVSCVIDFLTDHQKRVMAGEQGLKVIEQNRGSVDAHMKLIKEYL